MAIKGIRKSVQGVVPYVPGKTIEEVQQELGIDTVIKLGSNENSYAPYPKALAAMKEELEHLHMYPDASFEEIKDHIADVYGLKKQNIAVSHGAGGMLETLAKTFIEEGDEVIIPSQSYGLYREISKLMGGRPVEVSLNEAYRIDLDSVAEKINSRTKLIWLCNPNNPTGTLFDARTLPGFLDNLPEECWVVLDEAYAEMADQRLLPDTPSLIQKYNMIGVRTFSKAYGLAGARFGYAMAKPEMIRIIDTVAEPFNANRIAIAGAITVLRDEYDYAWNVIEKIRKTRESVNRRLTRLGWSPVQGHGNFVFVDTHDDANRIAAALLNMGMIVRSAAAWGYPNHLRITVGTEEEMDSLIEALETLLNGGKHA